MQDSQPTALTSADYAVDIPSGPPADPLLGRVVAERYRVVSQIGRGGMGVVYEVEHVAMGKLLAMKLISGELAQKADVVTRFRREALAASMLQCPNTVQVFDFGVADGLMYLVMELVPGEPMSRILRRDGPMSTVRLAKIVIQICNALAEAHDKGIVHRDIKPDNVMLMRTRDGGEIVKVLDFGLAKLRQADGPEEVTGRGVVLGTPYTMAPEQIRGDAVDERADIYGLGALMYLALTGYYPFQGKPADVLVQHLTKEPVPPRVRAMRLGIGQSMSDVVMRALRKEPSERYDSVVELQRRLVDEVSAAGSSSVEALLDATRVLELARSAEPSAQDWGSTRAFATRDDVDAYERGLRSASAGKRFVGGALAASAVLGVALWLAVGSDPASGAEREPNDTPASATPVALGTPAFGHLGKRIDETHGDRDFYVFDVPSTAGANHSVRITVTALPNLAMCTLVFRKGFTEPLAQYCAGRPAKDLVVPSLELEPGRYYLEVTQDVDSHGKEPVIVVENVSDEYRVSVDPLR